MQQAAHPLVQNRNRVHGGFGQYALGGNSRGGYRYGNSRQRFDPWRVRMCVSMHNENAAQHSVGNLYFYKIVRKHFGNCNAIDLDVSSHNFFAPPAKRLSNQGCISFPISAPSDFANLSREDFALSFHNETARQMRALARLGDSAAGLTGAAA